MVAAGMQRNSYVMGFECDGWKVRLDLRDTVRCTGGWKPNLNVLAL